MSGDRDYENRMNRRIGQWGRRAIEEIGRMADEARAAIDRILGWKS
jgi:hypothetical protein